jgi:hypothetical protein
MSRTSDSKFASNEAERFIRSFKLAISKEVPFGTEINVWASVEGDLFVTLAGLPDAAQPDSERLIACAETLLAKKGYKVHSRVGGVYLSHKNGHRARILPPDTDVAVAPRWPLVEFRLM